MSETVIADDGALLPLDALEQELAYADGFISTITVAYQGSTYVQTFTNNTSNVTNISGWIKQ